MSNRMREIVIAAAAAICIWAITVAAAPGVRAAEARTELNIVERDTSAYPHVSITVASGDLAGADVPEKAFTVLEDGKRVPATVERIPSDNLHVVLAIDTSGSMQGEPIDAAKRAAISFIQRMPAGTEVAVLGFSNTVNLTQPFTTDRDAAGRAVQSLEARGETALYDGIANASRLFGPAQQGRRAIVVLSDGGDTVSTASREGAAFGLAAAHANVSIVELVTPESDHASLQQLVSAAHGRLVAADDSAGLAAAYSSVAADLIGRYRISFVTSHHGSTPLAIDVAVGSAVLHATGELLYPAVAAKLPPAKPTLVVAHPGLFGTSLALALGLLAMFVAAAFGLAILFMPGRRPSRLAAAARNAGSSKSALSELAQRASAAAERGLDRRGRKRGLEARLEQAGLSMRAGEAVVIGVVASVAGLLVGLLLGGLLLAVVFAALVLVGMHLLLEFKRSQRSRAFTGQLIDMINILTSSLRAGYGLLQAVESAAREMEAPARDELRRVTTEVRLGRELGEAFESMAQRVGCEDFDWVVQAIAIHRDVGGDLAEVLDRVGETVRARLHLERQVRALSAEGRLSAIILVILPVALAGIMAVLNPGYLGELTKNGIGIGMIAGSVTLLGLGALWLRRIVRPIF